MNSLLSFDPDDTGEAFLARLPFPLRGAFKHVALTVGSRAGLTDPDAIALAIQHRLTERGDANAGIMLSAMREYPQELVSFCQSLLTHDTLPPDVKQQRKEMARAEGIGRHMDAQPPTQRQLNLLAGLNFRGVVRTRLEAAQQIERLLTGAKQKAGERRP